MAASKYAPTELDALFSKIVGKPTQVRRWDRAAKYGGGRADSTKGQVRLSGQFYNSLLKAPAIGENTARGLSVVAHEMGHLARGKAPGTPNDTGGVDWGDKERMIGEKWADEWAKNHLRNLVNSLFQKRAQRQQMLSQAQDWLSRYHNQL